MSPPVPAMESRHHDNNNDTADAYLETEDGATLSVRFSKDTKSQSNGHGHGSSHSHNSQTSTTINNNSNNNKTQSLSLRGNMTRTVKDRDPLFYYEVVAVLGVGSMGSVAKVRKRAAVVGGSARRDLVHHFRREKRLQTCFEIPLVGGFFQYCLKGLHIVKDAEEAIESIENKRQLLSRNSSILQPNAPAQNIYADGDIEDPTTALSGDSSEDNHQSNNSFDNNNHLDLSVTASNNSASISSSYEVTRAMKSIHLSRVTDPAFVEELKNEIRILRKLDHPHIVKAMETFEHRNQIFIVMELCSGGDLYTRDPYTEEEAARIVTSIVSAISYMHSKNICHRDLKYENIMFVNDSPKAEIKLIDFGLSMKYGNEELTEGVGTIYTMAPEVLKGKYTKQADMWSIGVIAFMLLSSQMPFYGRKRRHIVEQIMKGQYQYKGRRWKRVSAQAKAFCDELLVVDYEERADAEEALSMAWLNRRYAATVRNPHEHEMKSANASMMKYAKYAKIKKLALMVCAHKSTSREIGILRKVFQKYDTKKDGQLSYEEFKAAIKDVGYSEEDYRSIFDAVDLDGTGKIRYTEFLAATIEAQGAISEERLAEAFDRLDSDDSGFISKENLKVLLGDGFPQSEIDAIIDEADLTRDGKISYSEFLALWEHQNEGNRQTALNEVKAMTLNFVPSDRSISTENSYEESDLEADPFDPMSRANFIESKKSSERKVDVASGKRVGFAVSDQPDTPIPSTKIPEQDRMSFAKHVASV